MLTRIAKDSRLSFSLRVREFAVPPSVIETATARRCAGDWACACAAAHIDDDLNLPYVLLWDRASPSYGWPTQGRRAWL